MLTILDKVPDHITENLDKELLSGKNYDLSDEFKSEYQQFQKTTYDTDCIFGSGYTILKKKSDYWLFPNFYLKSSYIALNFLDKINEQVLIIKKLFDEFNHFQDFLTSYFTIEDIKKDDRSWRTYQDLQTFLTGQVQFGQEYIDYLRVNLSIDEILIFSNFLFCKSYRLKAKNPINGDPNNYFFRSDTFGSIVGKIFPINPTKHGDIISRITEELYGNKTLFNKLENSLIQQKSDIQIKDNHKSTPINKPYNRIIYGAPGTGKSYNLDKDIADNYSIRVTFNPEMTYGQFIGSYKPYMTQNEGNGKSISYELVPGKFLEAFIKAKTSDENIILIIEEINRANVAAVFGDVFQLLDRKENGESEYPISFNNEIMQYLLDQKVITSINEQIILPPNLYLWATMNSADQGVFAMDSAFKRRWSFEYLGINDGETANGRNDLDLVLNKNIKINWNIFRRSLNEYLIEERSLNIAEDKLLGPFFLSQTELGDSGFTGKLLLYLWDDVLRHKNRNKVFNLRTLSDFHTSSIKTETERDKLIQEIFAEGFSEKLITKLNA